MTLHTTSQPRRAPRGAPAMRVIRLLVASAVTGHMPGYCRNNSTEWMLQTLQSAAVVYRAENPEAQCVSIETLVDGDFMDESRHELRDIWNSPIWSICSSGRSVFVSLGPDRAFGARDDIVSRTYGARL